MRRLWKTIGLVGRFEEPRQVEEALSICTQPNHLHATLLKQGFLSFTTIANTLLSLYFRHLTCETALGFFHEMAPRCKDSVSWNIVIHGFLDSGCIEQGLCYFNLARRFPIFEPNVSTLVLVLQAWSGLGDKESGRQGHAYLMKTGLLAVLSIQNSLLGFYAGFQQCQQKLFDEIPHKDVVTWSLIISGYVKCGMPCSALVWFREMVSQPEIELDGMVLVSALNACAKVADSKIGSSIHLLAIRCGLIHELHVMNTLIDAYSKCGSSQSAFMVFRDMHERNQVSWNSMLSGFIHNENFYEAIELIFEMAKEQRNVDNVTVVHILKLSKHFIHVYWTKMVHCRIVRLMCHSNEVVMNSLIDSYATCNLIDQACQVFVGIKGKDVVLWSTIIAGFAHNGRPHDAISAFIEMTRTKIAPNSVTITNVVEACAVSAESKRAKWSHGIAVRRGFDKDVTVGTSIVSMYAKCGEIELSRKVFARIPDKNVVTWSAMIAACATNGLAEEAMDLMSRMKQGGLRPNSVTFLSALSACSHAGLVKEGLSIFESMLRHWKVEPQIEHYSCVVDLLGRSGMLSLALQLIKWMHRHKEVKGDANAVGAFLSACRSYVDCHFGGEATSHYLELEPSDSSGYLLGSGIYAAGGSYAQAAGMRLLARERGVIIASGHSILHTSGNVYKFVAGRKSSDEDKNVMQMVVLMHAHMLAQPSVAVTYAELIL